MMIIRRRRLVGDVGRPVESVAADQSDQIDFIALNNSDFDADNTTDFVSDEATRISASLIDQLQDVLDRQQVDKTVEAVAKMYQTMEGL